MDQYDYDETVAPENPPSAVVRPAARSAVLVTFLGGIVLLFLIVGAALLFWTLTDRAGSTADERGEPAAVGTTGDDAEPGGFDPAPQHGDTESELEFRGVNEEPQRPGR